MLTVYGCQFQYAISLVKVQGYEVTEAATSFGLHQALLSRWIKEHKEADVRTIGRHLSRILQLSKLTKW